MAGLLRLVDVVAPLSCALTRDQEARVAEIGKCPNCRKSIDEYRSESWCVKCGEPLPAEIASRLRRVVAAGPFGPVRLHLETPGRLIDGK